VGWVNRIQLDAMVRPHPDMTTLACITTVCGIIILGLSLPLAHRKVPMNSFYGVRIPTSFQSEQRWYDINAYGGRLLAKWSVPIILCGLVGFTLAHSAYPVYHWVVFGVVLFCTFAPLTQILIWASRLPKV
jgi:uncharacterized membrane protein